MIKTKKQMYIVIASFALILLLGTTTYAFFNYTRTGAVNRIQVGRIVFETEQGAGINLSNMFPIEANATNLSDATKVGTVTIDVSGDTTYTEGVEYLVSAVNVVNTAGTKQVPISIDVTYEEKENKTIGVEDSDYFTNRGKNSATSIYKVLAGDTISDNQQLVVGYIKRGETGIDGTITIKAYLDENKILISDTYDGTESDNMGTPNSLAQGKTVLTTTEWNALSTTGVSFQIKVEANEGIWVKQLNNMSLLVNSDRVGIGEIITTNITSNGDGMINCQSSDTNIAECSVTNNILIINGVSRGNATITVNQVATANYEGATVTYAAIVENGADIIKRLGSSQMENVAGAYRYIGSNPNNYVLFNCTNGNDTSTCEQWRIIGVYGDNLKIIKATPLSENRLYNYAPENNLDENSWNNNWEDSALETYLNQTTNGGYYYSLNDNAKAMIVNGTWNVGKASSDNNASQSYSNAQTSSIIRKVGLIAIYEYLYAADSSCHSVAGNVFGSSSCASKDWLTPALPYYNDWSLTAGIEKKYSALSFNPGTVFANTVANKLMVRPVVYLNSNVIISDGTGEPGGNEYILSYNAS